MNKFDLFETKNYLTNIGLNNILYLKRFLKSRILYLKTELKYYKKIKYSLNSTKFLIKLDIEYDLLNSLDKLNNDLLLVNSILNCFTNHTFLSLFFDISDFNYSYGEVSRLFSFYDYLYDFQKDLLQMKKNLKVGK